MISHLIRNAAMSRQVTDKIDPQEQDFTWETIFDDAADRCVKIVQFFNAGKLKNILPLRVFSLNTFVFKPFEREDFSC